jgi:hypothetical protein
MENNKLVYYFTQNDWVENIKLGVVYSNVCCECQVRVFFFVRANYMEGMPACLGHRHATIDEFNYVDIDRRGVSTINEEIACHTVLSDYYAHRETDCNYLRVVNNLMDNNIKQIEAKNIDPHFDKHIKKRKI